MFIFSTVRVCVYSIDHPLDADSLQFDRMIEACSFIYKCAMRRKTHLTSVMLTMPMRFCVNKNQRDRIRFIYKCRINSLVMSNRSAEMTYFGLLHTQSIAHIYTLAQVTIINEWIECWAVT